MNKETRQAFDDAIHRLSKLDHTLSNQNINYTKAIENMIINIKEIRKEIITDGKYNW